MKDFFISYNRNDRDWAEWLAWTLEEAGYTVVFQAWDFLPGENFVLRMEEALNETRKLIAVLSQDYIDATYTKAEWTAAFVRDPTGKERVLLPVRVRKCEPPRLLATIIYADLVGLAEEEAKVAIIRAADESSSGGRPSTSPRFPGGGGPPKPPAAERVAKVAKLYPGLRQRTLSSNEMEEALPNLGLIVSKSCDRVEQEEAFDTSLHDAVRENPGYPQLYVVHGPPRERHSSFIERLRETFIQDYADYLAGQEKAAVEVWEVKWPVSGKVETDLTRLIEGLLEKRDSRYRYEKSEYTAHAFRELILPLQKQVIVVQHEIEAKKWRPETGRLIEAYLKFWDEVKADKDIPLFLIFLSVVYPAIPSGGWWKIWEVVERLRREREKKQIKNALSRVGNLFGRQPTTVEQRILCLYTLLKELPCVKLEDMEKWFKRHRLGRNEVAWETQSRNIFRLKGWDFDECKNMADVEDALDEFINVMAAGIDPKLRLRANQ
jgi:hypothetical protein